MPRALWRPGQGEEFNSDILKDPKLSLLAPYMGKNVSVFKCPADARLAIPPPLRPVDKRFRQRGLFL